MQRLGFLFVLILLLSYKLCAQSSLTDTSQYYASDSALSNIDSTLFFSNDTINLNLNYLENKKLPKNLINMPKAPTNPFEIDYRTSSYYTPKLVQDKMDQIMNRPRSDSFMPVLAMAFFAASIAAKQLQIEKLFELTAEDYLVGDLEWKLLESLWHKSPQKIDALYLNSSLHYSNTAQQLQDALAVLADKSLVKTREAEEKVILFFPAQDKQTVSGLFQKALKESSNDSTRQKIYSKYLLLSSSLSSE